MSVKKLEKPDPGENYRLLEKSPVEALKPGDEFFVRGTNSWYRSDSAEMGGVQEASAWYRRKIEPVKPKYAVGQRVKIVGPPAKGVRAIYNWSSEMDQYIGSVGTVRLKPTQDPEGTFYVVGEIVGWSFREDYLEPVVEPVEAKTPGHPMCRCYVDPAILKPAQAKPNVLYPKIGDVIFLPEVGRLRVTARGFEIC